MQRRARLRHRLFAMTAIHAAMLIGITLLLTWRARDSHRQVHQLISVDGHVISQFEQLQRMQGAFTARWTSAANGSPEALQSIASHYRIVRQLLDDPTVEGAEAATLRKLTGDFAAASDRWAANWPAMTPEMRLLAQREMIDRSEAIRGAAQRMAAARQREIDRKIPDLEVDASNTMFVALGIVYIVAIVSFFLVKMTLTKVVAPLENLTGAARKITTGDYSSRVRVAGDHEIAELSERFNEMVEALSTMTNQLAHQARTDDLTGLPNFRSFKTAIQSEIERAARYEEAFGVLVFDLDHFKRYNDTYGHLAGNDALQAVAGVIRRALRAVDTPARYGGEEFAAIIPQIDPRGLFVIAERIRAGIEQLPVPEGRTGITISIGGAIYPHDGLTANDLFKSADSRLYEAKERGRNCVVIPDERKRLITTA